MPHAPRHSGGFSSKQSVIGGGSSSTSSPPSQPSSPQDYFGSMYTSPGSSFTGSGSSEEEDKKIDKILGGGSSGGSGGGSDNQDNNQVTETKEEKKSNNFLTDAANLFNEYIGMGGLTGMGAKGIGAIFDSVFKPKASTFKNQNNLSIINDLLKNENDLQRYYSQYRDTIEDAGFGTFDQFAADVRESKIPQGSEAQRRLNPEDYYDEDLFVSSGEQNEMLKDYPEFLEKMGLKPMSSRFANTTGNLVDIASIPVTPEMQGNNPEFVKRIFEARMELDRMGKDSSGNPQGGIMTASSAPPAPPPVVPPAEDEVPENPILNPIMSQRDPFDLAKFYASLPQYTQQGVMSPSLMQYYRNLGLFPRV